MRIGPLVRRLSGSHEHRLAEAYRRIFVNLDDFARLLRTWVPDAKTILEVGCGEGAMTERIVALYPNASVTAIDLTPSVGRLYRGPALPVTFCQETVENIASRKPSTFDLVILCDVLHHVPLGGRAPLIRAINQAMARNGSLIFKDWVTSFSPIHWLCYISDRYFTGDQVAYFTMDGITSLLSDTFGPGAIRQRGNVRPWHNNVALMVRR